MSAQFDAPAASTLSFADLGSLDAVGLRALIQAGQIRPAEILEVVFRAIEALNPALNAVVHPMREEAFKELSRIAPDAPLAGVPYLLKDLGPSYAGVPTRMACMALKDGYMPQEDSYLTQRFRALGTVPAGKSASPEFGLTGTTESVLHGPTRNPWNLSLSPGGSSGGSAAAVAAGIVPVAHGNDGGGSIRIPASACGLVGFKCSRGLVSWAPELGDCWGALATNGVLTRSVRDSAYALDGICGTAAGDPHPFPKPPLPFTAEMQQSPGKLRIAYALQWPAGASKPSDDSCKAVLSTAHLLEGLGHTVEEAAPEISLEELIDIFIIIVAAQVRVTLNPLLPAGVTAPDSAHAEKLTRLLWEKARNDSGADYAGAINRMHLIGRSMASFFQKYDVLLTPVMSTPPAPLGKYALENTDLEGYGSMFRDFIPYTAPYNMSGAPAVSLPLFKNNEGLPIGIQLGTAIGRDGLLFRLSAQLEQAAPWAAHVPTVHVSHLQD